MIKLTALVSPATLEIDSVHTSDAGTCVGCATHLDYTWQATGRDGRTHTLCNSCLAAATWTDEDPAAERAAEAAGDALAADER